MKWPLVSVDGQDKGSILDGEKDASKKYMRHVGQDGRINSLSIYTRVDPQNQLSRIPFNPNRVQHILRHFYYATMQKLCKFEAL